MTFETDFDWNFYSTHVFIPRNTLKVHQRSRYYRYRVNLWPFFFVFLEEINGARLRLEEHLSIFKGMLGSVDL